MYATVQGDQLYIAVYLWYLVKRDLSSFATVHKRQYTNATFYKVPDKHGHVYLVGLYNVQGDQLCIAVYFWYLVKHDLQGKNKGRGVQNTY